MTKDEITEAEYLEQLDGLYEKLRAEMPNASDQELCAVYQEREFDLLVDFRLGKDFPSERRQALHELQRQALKRMEELTTAMSSGELPAHDFGFEAQRLVRQMKAEFANLLDPDELEALFGGGFPGIPLDPELVGKV